MGSNLVAVCPSSACHCSRSSMGCCLSEEKNVRLLSSRCFQIDIFVLATSCLPCLLHCLFSAAWVLCLHPFSFFLCFFCLNLKKEGGKKKVCETLLLPKWSWCFYKNRLLWFFQVTGKITTLCHIENWMMTVFRNAFDQQHTKHGTKYVGGFNFL